MFSNKEKKKNSYTSAAHLKSNENSVALKDNRPQNKVLQGMFSSRKKISYKSEDAMDARDWREEDRDIKGRNIATLYYRINETGEDLSTSEHSDGFHSEKLIMLELIKLYGDDYKSKLTFDTLFTERDACGSDYHNCREKVEEWFPEVKVTYSAEYDSEGAYSSDKEGTSKEKAKASRQRGTKKVKRIDKHAGMVADGKADWDDFSDSEDE